MKKNYLKRIIAVFSIAALSILLVTQFVKEVGEINRKIISIANNILKLDQNFGAISIPSAPYQFQTSLQSSISTTDSSMTLVSGTLKDGTPLTGYNCFTLDAGTASIEYVCGTVSGTSVTGLLRGINPLNPAATSTTLIFSHRRGADVRITDFPILQIIKRLVDGTDSFPNRISLDSSIATSSFTTYNLITKQYVDGVALQGSPTATTTGDTAGVVKIANATQIANGTGMSGSYTLVPSAALFNQTPTAAIMVPVTNSNGKLPQGFLNLSENWTFSGMVTHSATTTLATTTITSLTINSVDVGSRLKFGGDGSDGELIATSTTITIDAGGAREIEKNYTSVSITGTGKLAFINPHPNGTIIVLKSQGDFTVDCSASPCIDASKMGASGGAAVNATSGQADGNDGYDGYGIIWKSNKGPAGKGTGSGYGAGITAVVYSTSTLPSKYIEVFVGAGGGSGRAYDAGGVTATSGKGGRGGGGLIIEVGGRWNFTTTNGISVAGENGDNGSYSGGSNGKAGGGGGGGGGMLLVLYNFLTANSGTVTVSGGIGGNSRGTSGSSNAYGGGGGGSDVSGTAGVLTTYDNEKGGGDGGVGRSLIIKNTRF